MRSLVALVVVLGSAAPVAADKAPPAEFLEEAKRLSIVGACAKGETQGKTADLVATHCKKVTAEQDAWKKSWLAVAAPFFQTTVPKTLPKTVVYPFAGGDLATALAVFPDAEEITTLALEPAGDPRSLGRMNDPDLKKALAVVASELEYLYRSSFSKTMNMISAMRAGQLPTQLVFSLSALHMHGYELTGVRYFKLDGAGDIVYLTTADADAAGKIKDVGARNRAFGNVEIKFKRPGKKDQIYRHIAANLDNTHLAQLAAPLKHLQKKGKVSAMTKAASYLLSYGDFSTFRDYLVANVEWMVSDTTGIPPSYGMPAGFEYETYGDWKSSNMAAGNGAVRSTWQALYQQKPGKPLGFKFGYPNGAGEGHLIITKRTGNKQPAYLLRWEKTPQPTPPKAPQRDTDPVPPAQPITRTPAKK